MLGIGDGMSSTHKKIGIIIILSLLFFGICWWLGRDSGISEKNEILEAESGQTLASDEEMQLNTVSEVEVMRILHLTDIYSIRQTTASNYKHIYKNNNFIGESVYTPANSEKVIMYDLSSMQGTDEYTGDGIYSDEQTTYEEGSDEPLNITDGISVEYRAVEDGLVYQMDKIQTRLYLQTFYSEGYTLDTQIATSVYNKLYLHNVTTDSWYSIIVVNSMDLVIVSELDDFSGVDINKIMEIQ